MKRNAPLKTMFDPMDLLPPTPSSERPSTARSMRVRTTEKEDTGKASAKIQIEISVQSITFSAEEQSAPTQESMYLQTMLHFYCLVQNDYDAVLTCARTALAETYNCASVVLRAEGSLLFTLAMPRAKLVTLQCDQSSGQLEEMIDGCMITKDLMHELNVTHLQLSTQVMNKDLGTAGAIDILDT